MAFQYQRIGAVPFLFVLLFSISHGMAAPVAEDSCRDERLERGFKEELEPDAFEKKCELSLAAQAEFYRTQYQGPDGQKQEMTCCSALRFLAYDSAKEIMKKKKALCAETLKSIPQGDCSGAYCFEKMEASYKSASEGNLALAEMARKARQTAEKKCPSAFLKMRQVASKDVSDINKIMGKYPEERAKIEKSSKVRRP